VGLPHTKLNRTTSSGSGTLRAVNGGSFALRSGGEAIELSAGSVTVGRASDCGLQLEGGMVSRHHARLRQTEDGLVVEDLGSRNGVLVNQRKIDGPTLLVHGDELGIGLQSFEVVDARQLRRSEHLSTLPPASSPFAVSDVAAYQQETLVARVDVLSPREREVLELIVLGHTQKEMAERLHVSVKTIETHRTHIAEKLGCRTRAELVSYAISAGVLSRLTARRGP
jgi:DNA-binding CsgD family transcriptional regulator